MSKQVKKSEVTDLIAKGFTKKQIAEHYDVAAVEATRILQTFGLRIKSRKAVKNAVEYIDDTIVSESANNEVETKEEIENFSKEPLNTTQLEDVHDESFPSKDEEDVVDVETEEVTSEDTDADDWQ